MRSGLEILTIVLAALVLSPALAHALEFPGKKRLSRDAYFTVQRIYYPGFTVAGVAEPAALIASAVLLTQTPRGAVASTLTWIAVLGFAGMQAVFWMLVQPVNRAWLEGADIGTAGRHFFGLDKAQLVARDWTVLRDRWEYSHIARAGLAAVSFVALLLAATVAY